MSAECGNCRFSNIAVLSDGPQIECHRFPPTVVGCGDGPLQVRPQVQPEYWCGEHQPDRVDPPRPAGQ